MNIVEAVSDRKTDRAKLGIHITKFISFFGIGSLAFIFKGSSDSNWIFVSGCVTGILLIFSFFELWAVVKIFLAKPIRLNPSQSKLLGAKGIDFEVKQSKPKPNVLNTRDMETSLSSCLLNRSLDSPKNGQPLKKSNVQSPTILRNRRSLSTHNQSITEEHELEEYLGSFNKSADESILSTSPLKTWSSPMMRPHDPLSRYQYQLSRSPPKNRTADKITDFDNDSKGGNSFEKLNISGEQQSRWAINLRNFIWATIVNPLVKQIETVNNKLKVSLPDVSIGKTSITDLRAINNVEIQNEIRVLLPYLEVTSNHGYLIARLKTLAAGGYLSGYIWNGGQYHEGKEWCQNDFPTDSKILIHILSCWLDTHLPPDPSAGPDARAFSERYVLKKTDGDKKLTLKELPSRVPFALVEKTTNPPEYYVQSRTEIKELPAGRSNPLGAVLLLFYLLNKENYGEIAGVSLGRAGINILAVYD